MTLLPRREFLQTTIGAISGMVMPRLCHAANTVEEEIPHSWTSEYQQILAASDDFDWLGIPPSWSCVHRGFHPFSPERTLILNSQKVNRHPMVPDLVERIGRHLNNNGVHYNHTTLSHLVCCAAILTEQYGVPSYLEKWSEAYAMSFFCYYGQWTHRHMLLQRFSWQRSGQPVCTRNEVVDWWMFLIPYGLEVPDGIFSSSTPLHVLITPVYSNPDHCGEFSKFYIPMGNAAGYLCRAEGNITEDNLQLSGMDQRSACLLLNERIARNLSKNN